jgi:hypothetical protein
MIIVGALALVLELLKCRKLVRHQQCESYLEDGPCVRLGWVSGQCEVNL